jgi:hypothetical protein
VRARAALDLREIRLAQATADLTLHCGGQLLLSHRTAQAPERAFHGPEGAKFVTEFHDRLSNIAICKFYIAISNLSSKIGRTFSISATNTNKTT